MGYGGPERLEIRDHDTGEPGPGEALVTVRAAGVNAWDVKSYSGRFGDDPAKLPLPLGSEASGVVEAVGPGAVGPAGPVSVGDEVIVYPTSGAYADRLVVGADSVLPKPAALTWERAAGMMLTGVAAAHLVAATAVGEGDVVLLHGAAGGVGLAAAQLALRRGARVIGSAHPSDHAVLRELGVEPLDYRGRLVESVRRLAPEGVDAVLDAVGTEPVLDVSLEVARDRSRIATLIPSPAAGSRGVQQLGNGSGADPGRELRSAARLELVRAVEQGWFRVIVAAAYPLDQVTAAHRAMAGEHPAGKIVLVP